MTAHGAVRFVYFAAHRCPGCRESLDGVQWSADRVLRCDRCGLVLAAGDRATSAEREAARLVEELADHARAADAVLAEAYRHSTTEVATDAVATEPGTPAAPPGVVAGPGSVSWPVAARRGLSSVSVPALLLALGGLSLVVAAAVFLAMHWSAMSLTGRTLVLLAVTAASAASTLWVARRGLRAATETLSTLTVGLAVIDVHGAWYAGLLPSWSFLAARSTHPIDAAVANPTTATLAYATLLTAATLGWAGLVATTATLPAAGTRPPGAASPRAPARVRGPELLAALGVLVCLGAAASLGPLIGHEPQVAALYATAAAVVAAVTLARFATFARVGLAAAIVATSVVAGTAMSSAFRARTLFQEDAATGVPDGLGPEVWTLAWTAAFTVAFALSCAALAARACNTPARRHPWQSWAAAAGWAWLLVLSGIVVLTDATGWVVALSTVAVLAAGLHAVGARASGPDTSGPLRVVLGAIRAWVVLAGVAVTAMLAVLATTVIVGGGSVLLSDEPWRSGPGARWPVVDDVVWWWLPVTAVAVAAVAWSLRWSALPAPRTRALTDPLPAAIVLAAVTAAAAGAPLWLLAVVLLLAATTLLTAARPALPWLVAAPVALLGLLTVHGSPAAALLIGLVLAGVTAGWPRQSLTRLRRLASRGPSAPSGADTPPGDLTAWAGVAATSTVLAVAAFTVCLDWWTPTTAPLIGLLAVATAGAVAVAQWFRTPEVAAPLRRAEAGWSVLVVGAVTSAVTLDAAAPQHVHPWWLPIHLVALGVIAGVFATLSALEDDRQVAREALAPAPRPGRGFAWCAAALVLASSWVRLTFEDVSLVEAYTLPAALVLGVFTAIQVRDTPEVRSSSGLPRSVTAAAATASLLLLPSLAALADEPVSWRAVWVAVVCASALVWGLRTRVAAGVVYGCLGAAALILIEAAPVAAAAPRWVALAVAGVLLVAGGVRWEHVLATGRQVWFRMGQMR